MLNRVKLNLTTKRYSIRFTLIWMPADAILKNRLSTVNCYFFVYCGLHVIIKMFDYGDSFKSKLLRVNFLLYGTFVITSRRLRGRDNSYLIPTMLTGLKRLIVIKGMFCYESQDWNLPSFTLVNLEEDHHQWASVDSNSTHILKANKLM